MPPKGLSIPKHLKDVKIDRKTDTLEITCTETCCWSYDSIKGIFNPPPAGFLAAGTVQPGSYGPYQAIGDGIVAFDAAPGDCPPGKHPKGKPKDGTGHTITVSGGSASHHKHH
jgi:hypothetical protein